ncbi:PaaX family transcriptional regulator C-terminal domain-containing protein [Micromonospora sp. KC721]|uniref:PaaX family transcriptional regulator n=1 Tax=Micromonospora sp. KC721 TaxID=2530380 RepID=UPI0010494E1A|nr:PaaX family transcriptional regulator C-terminal domain-containing protein [Micromonospora sp. KC721]TDB81831.1 PaaX family transcriptional regulator [Micromonospora sp. KC721]
MVRPFNIEEIFPEAPGGSPRRRRRQTGSSAQGLAVTLLADYTARTRAWLPSAVIVALLGEFGVSSGAARTTISRLARRGVLEGSRQGRYSSYRLTEPAAVDLSMGGASIAALATQPESWDGSWTVVAFSMPEGESTRRRALRVCLRWHGFAPLYDGVWVLPHPLDAKGRAELAALARGAVTVFRAQHTELETETDRDPVSAWDLPAIAEQYAGFIQRWVPLLRRIAAGAVTGTAALRARTEVMDVFRRIPVLDPMLPTELMPPDWPRARAREVFVAIYDGLAAPAEDHVRAVAARVTGVPHPNLRAHTTAEMAAGIRPWPN